MIDTNQLLVFVPAALALNLTPGNDMMFCLGQGLRYGPRAGVAASVGIATGSLIQCLLAAFGLAALLATLPLAFDLIRWAGICYLLWLGWQTIRRPSINPQTSTVESGTLFRAWRQGVIVNLLNPKIAIFVLAFIPQFVDPARGSPVIQFLLLGAILNVGGTLINALVGGFSGSIGKTLTLNKTLARLFAWFSGLVFFALAIKLALDSPRTDVT